MKHRLTMNSAWLWIAPLAVLLIYPACDDDETSPASTSSSGTAGTGGSGGSGGATSSGTGGTAGSGGSGQLSCSDFCTDLHAAGCDNGPDSVEACEATCDPLVVMCPDETAALADCLGSGGTYSCDADGNVALEGCEGARDTAVACMGARVAQCNDSCPAVVDAGCTNGPPEINGCEQGCLISALSCPAELVAVLDCAGTSPEFSCDANEYPFPDGCESEQQALLACLGAL